MMAARDGGGLMDTRVRERCLNGSFMESRARARREKLAEISSLRRSYRVGGATESKS